jgi:hypothetical protein
MPGNQSRDQICNAAQSIERLLIGVAISFLAGCVMRPDPPDRILAGFQTPCVALEGGSYFFGKLDSAPVPLVLLAR